MFNPFGLTGTTYGQIWPFRPEITIQSNPRDKMNTMVFAKKNIFLTPTPFSALCARVVWGTFFGDEVPQSAPGRGCKSHLDNAQIPSALISIGLPLFP